MSQRRTQPEWSPPNDLPARFSVKNSLTRSKVPFRPIDGDKNHVSWYNCGPTVYDHSHMGHARSYICIDILRRIVQDYFGYNVTFVQGLTDIDDKIILRARQNYLFENFQKSPPANWEAQIQKALSNFKNKLEKEENADKKKMFQGQFDKASAAQKIDDSNQRISESKDILVDLLDKELGSTVTDNSIFWTLPRFFEADFWNDMDNLNVRRPTCQIRVSDCVPEIITFIEGIIKNGFGYESNGSVYFNVKAFNESNGKHFYAKLEPENMGNMELVDDGEGKLAAAVTEKKSPNDFALWKKSKPGEPTWDSPWSSGRPGWHIECSVMSTYALGDSFDIHTGGVDLKFPHHDNEIAQSEACFGKDSWCYYFMHTGHLHIDGCKMSKSLKNFITIKDALNKHGARKLRLAFLIHYWDATLDYSDKTMNEVEAFEKYLNEFFLNVKDFQRKFSKLEKDQKADRLQKPSESAVELMNNFDKTKKDIHAHLADNFDTVSTLHKIKELVKLTNNYSSSVETTGDLQISLVEDIAKYITKMFKIFGVIGDEVFTSIGFESDVHSISGINNSSADNATPQEYLDAFSDFRELIRQIAISNKDNLKQNILLECDNLRNDTLPNLGVRLEDTDKGPRIKIIGKKQAILEKEAQEKEIKAKEEKKRLAAEKKAKEQAEKNAKNAISHTEMFKLEENLKLLKLDNMIGRFTKFEENGLPTHEQCEENEEKEISKKGMKNIQKVYQKQQKEHEKWRASQTQEHVEWLSKQ